MIETKAPFADVNAPIGSQAGWRLRRLVRLIGVFILLLVALLPGGHTVSAQGGGWSTPLDISNTPGESRYQEIAADPWGNVHAVWSEDEDGEGWGESIYYAMWDGQTWTKPVDIFYTPPTGHIPAIAADREGYLHLIWDANNQVFNVGADTPYSVNELAEVVAGAMGVAPEVAHLPARNEVLHAFSSHEKVRRVFGEGEPVPLAEGVRRMAAWARRAGSRQSGIFGQIEIPRNLPPSWAEAYRGQRSADEDREAGTA